MEKHTMGQQLFIIAVGLCIGNFVYQFLIKRKLELAIDLTYYQCIALLIVYYWVVV